MAAPLARWGTLEVRLLYFMGDVATLSDRLPQLAGMVGRRCSPNRHRRRRPPPPGGLLLLHSSCHLSSARAGRSSRYLTGCRAVGPIFCAAIPRDAGLLP